MAEDISNKPQLSHTTSLPVGSDDQHLLEPPPIRRKQASLYQKRRPPADELRPAQKSWSFGSVAKAVGNGVTAFSSGVVQGTKVVGTGVVTGSKVVGTGVVQGTMAVGTGVVHGTKTVSKVTKDVTIAAGKGVVQAGEMVGSAAVSGVSAVGTATVTGAKAVGTATVTAGKVVGNVTVNAVSDTTTWVKEKRESLIGSDVPVHLVMPGEDLECIAEQYNIPELTLIRANYLENRHLRPGKELILASQISTDSSCGGLVHPLEHVQIEVFENGSKTEPLVFTLDDVQQGSDPVLTWDEVSVVHCELLGEDTEPVPMPQLIPATEEDLPKKAFIFSTMSTEDDSSSTADTLDFDDEAENVRMKVVLFDTSTLTYTLTYGNFILVSKFMGLWFPNKTSRSDGADRVFDRFTRDIFEVEMDREPPEMSDISGVLNLDQVMHLHKVLPLQNQNQRWQLEYTTSEHGFSLQNFYRKVEEISEPLLIVLEDTAGTVFGAFITCIPRVSDEFLGNGQSWLYSFRGGTNTFEFYPWSGLNEYFVQCNVDSMVVGSSDGNFGIFMDGDLHKGRTQACDTFNNPPLTQEDFVLQCFECWSFA